MKEHELVALTEPLAEQGLEPGDVGTVVHAYGDGDAFEVEFTTAEGRTITVLTLSAGKIRPLAQDEILHARRRPAALS
jgi:hypothetical protein